jgi:hypothetical protein
MAELSFERSVRGSPAPVVAARSDQQTLRMLVTGAGLAGAALFVIVALHYRLQEYADGSMFSYAVAVRDAWAFHWHNISGRVFVYLFTSWPAEMFTALTRDPAGGIFVYGLMFYAAPLLGLALTYAADRSEGRIIFVYACASTAVLCPLVFGFPTEMWIAHALFWPALAICHYARRGPLGFAMVFAVLLALILTHGGALVLAVAVLCTVLLRGLRDALVLRTTLALLLVLMAWAAVHAAFPPDAYFGRIVMAAALNFIDITGLVCPMCVLLLGALAGYAGLCVALPGRSGGRACAYAALIVAAGLAVYWLWFDRTLLTDQRYPLRTALLIGTPVLGAIAAAFALRREHRLHLPVPLLPQLLAALSRPAAARVATGALMLVLLIHAVETAKFVVAWTDYRSAMRELAMGSAADPSLGDGRFVSSGRIPPKLNRLSWFSTTPYLSVLVAPGFAPKRLVVDPADTYFWLSCETATANEQADRAVPRKSRALVRLYSCEHRG